MHSILLIKVIGSLLDALMGDLALLSCVICDIIIASNKKKLHTLLVIIMIVRRILNIINKLLYMPMA